jgi:carotenoid cleavage dioxygenase-like enzyme
MSQAPSQPRIAERAAAWLGRQLQKRVPYAEHNPFLEGPFAPVQQEVTETTLKVTGTLPPELDGIYARIGPNPLEVPNPAAYHWFMGDGMVHGVRLSGGRALWYRNRWIGSDTLRQAQGRKRLPGPRQGVSDVVNTNVYGHAGRIWASTEAGVLPVQLDGELESLRHGLFDSPDALAYTAHPHLDPQTGELHAVCYDAVQPNKLRYLVVDAKGALTRRVDIPVQHGPMVHDCAISRRYVVVLDLPVTFQLSEVMRGSGLPYAWNPKHPARVGLLPRDGTAEDIRWCALDPCYVFHTCNAFDLEDGRVVMDVVVHDRMFDQSRQGPELDRQQVTLERWTMDPQRASVAREVLAAGRQEFPRCDERLSTEPYRYAYTVESDPTRDSARLLRYDFAARTQRIHDYGKGRVSGEAVFVPRSAQGAEDDGWLVSLVYDRATDRSDLVVVNAQDFGGEPQAVVHLPVRVPMGFHGNWVPLV